MKLFIVYRNNGYRENNKLDYCFRTKEDTKIFSRIISHWDKNFKVSYIDFRKRLNEISRSSIPKDVEVIDNLYNYTSKIVSEKEDLLIFPADDDDLFDPKLLEKINAIYDPKISLYKFKYQQMNLPVKRKSINNHTGNFDIESNHAIYNSKINKEYINTAECSFNSNSLNETHCALDEYYNFLYWQIPRPIIEFNEPISLDVKGVASISLLFPFWNEYAKMSLYDESTFMSFMKHGINSTSEYLLDIDTESEKYKKYLDQIISLYGELL